MKTAKRALVAAFVMSVVTSAWGLFKLSMVVVLIIDPSQPLSILSWELQAFQSWQIHRYYDWQIHSYHIYLYALIAESVWNLVLAGLLLFVIGRVQKSN